MLMRAELQVLADHAQERADRYAAVAENPEFNEHERAVTNVFETFWTERAAAQFNAQADEAERAAEDVAGLDAG